MTRLDKQTKDAKKPEAAQGATAEEGGAEVEEMGGLGLGNLGDMGDGMGGVRLGNVDDAWLGSLGAQRKEVFEVAVRQAGDKFFRKAGALPTRLLPSNMPSNVQFVR